jgi:hypothetical protein
MYQATFRCPGDTFRQKPAARSYNNFCARWNHRFNERWKDRMLAEAEFYLKHLEAQV